MPRGRGGGAKRKLPEHNEALCRSGTPWKATGTVGNGTGWGWGKDQERRQSPRARAQSGNRQEAGPWIPQILLTDLSGTEVAAPGSAPPPPRSVQAHCPSLPRGEAAFLPAPPFPSAASSHPGDARLTLHPGGCCHPRPPHPACPCEVCGWRLSVPSLEGSGPYAHPVAPRRLGPVNLPPPLHPHPTSGKRLQFVLGLLGEPQHLQTPPPVSRYKKGSSFLS